MRWTREDEWQSVMCSSAAHAAGGRSLWERAGWTVAKEGFLAPQSPWLVGKLALMRKRTDPSELALNRSPVSTKRFEQGTDGSRHTIACRHGTRWGVAVFHAYLADGNPTQHYAHHAPPHLNELLRLCHCKLRYSMEYFRQFGVILSRPEWILSHQPIAHAPDHAFDSILRRQIEP